MSVDAPDPRTFKSWEDAFQYAIPAVRGMQKKLHSSASESQDKIRSLVGASYRDLLETARKIIEVNNQVKTVEASLGAIGKKSEPQSVKKMNSNYARFERYQNVQDRERLMCASQVAVLQRILQAASRFLEEDKESLFVTKLLVISRLLHKTLSDSNEQAKVVDKLRSRLVSLRARLLRVIDRKLANSGLEVIELVKDLSAFSLATSATPTDALKHFQNIRLEFLTRLEQQSEAPSLEQSTLDRLRHYLQTIKLSEEIFPRLLSGSLKLLGSRPLFRDEFIREIEALDLDIHDQWLTDDVKNFTPWLRHDELQATKASQLINSWAQHALEVFARHLQSSLASASLQSTYQIRRETFKILLSFRLSSGAQKLSVIEVADILNSPFEINIKSLIQTQSTNFGRLVAVMETELDRSDTSRLRVKPLWDKSTLNTGINDGASKFRYAIVNRCSGRSDGLRRVLRVYEQTTKDLTDTRNVLKEMRNFRWDDYLDGEDDEANTEDLFDLLKRGSADGLDFELQKAVQQAISEIESSLLLAVEKSLAQDSVNFKKCKAITILRLVRELSQKLPDLCQDITLPIPSEFGAETLDILGQYLVTETSGRVAPAFAESCKKFIQTTRLPPCELWLGTPPLPVQPSTLTFRYLRTLIQNMEDLGFDIWSSQLTSQLKAKLAQSFTNELHTLTAVPRVKPDEKMIDGTDAARDTTEGTREPSPTIPVDVYRNKLIQLVFDTAYMQHCLSPSNSYNGGYIAGASPSPKDSFTGLIVALCEQVSLSKAEEARVLRSAAEYWRRTYLLFGLLTGDRT